MKKILLMFAIVLMSVSHQSCKKKVCAGTRFDVTNIYRLYKNNDTIGIFTGYEAYSSPSGGLIPKFQDSIDRFLKAGYKIDSAYSFDPYRAGRIFFSDFDCSHCAEIKRLDSNNSCAECDDHGC